MTTNDETTRWTTTLATRPTCAPTQMRDLTIIRCEATLHAFDDRGHQVWTRELDPACTDGEISANDDILAVASRFEGVTDTTRLEFFDEGAEKLAQVQTEGMLRQGGLVVHTHSLHAWVNDKGLALRKMKLPPTDDVLVEPLVPHAQPWDGNVTKRGVVLVSFAGSKEGASLWDPRTGRMTPLIRGKNVWSHAVSDDVAVFAIGDSEAQTTLVGVDIQSGLELWRRANASFGIASCDAGVLVYLGTTDRVPALLDRHTGELLWRAPRVHAGVSFKIVGPTVIAHGPRSLVLDLATGAVLDELTFDHILGFDDHYVTIQGTEVVAREFPTLDVQPHVIIPSSPARQTPVMGTPTPRLSTPIVTPRVSARRA